MRTVIKPISIAVALLLSGLAAFSASEALAANYYVTDGDTLHIGNTTIRLQGIDAPESGQLCKGVRSGKYPCGARARQALQNYLSLGPVRCKQLTTDRYGRAVGYCFAGTVNVNKAMVANGYARAFVKYSTEFVADERKAKSLKRGFWIGQWQAPWEWRAAKLATFAPQGQCVIKGNIGKGGKVYYLPFSGGYERVKIDKAKGERWFCTEGDAMRMGWRRKP